MTDVGCEGVREDAFQRAIYYVDNIQIDNVLIAIASKLSDNIFKLYKDFIK